MNSIIGAVGAGILMIVGLLVLSFILSWPVYMLWSGCAVGAIDGVQTVTWLQAWGLTVLCGFLFKSTSKK